MSGQQQAWHPDGARPQQSTREVAALALTQGAALLGREIALARAELMAQARQYSMGGLALSAGALAGISGWLALLAAAVLGLTQAVPAWLACLIVGAVLCLLSAGAAAWAARRLAGAGRPLPMTTESLRRDLELLHGVRRPGTGAQP